MESMFLEAMKFRHACKAFDPAKKIEDATFQQILEMGQLSPSSFGFEPWKFAIIQNETLRERLKAFSWGAQGQLPTASHFVIILARKKESMIYNSEYIRHMMEDVKQLPADVVAQYKEFYETFQKKDFDLLESDRSLFDWATKQTYIALANMMTGAAFLGVDSCPMEGFDMEMMEAFLKDELDIDTEVFGAAVMVAFGYRQEAPREKMRQKIEDIVTWYH